MRAALLATAVALTLAACQPAPKPTQAPSVADIAEGAAAAPTRRVAEAFLTPMTPADNIDSPASWRAADGRLWLIATAKATDKLVVYDGQTGKRLRDVGVTGAAPGQFDRPNGISVIGDLVFVVERDNHRVQVLQLPDFKPLGVFGGADLRKPYGLWVNPAQGGYDVYVTDSYHDGEDSAGNDILPALERLNERVRRYHVALQDSGLQATLVRSIGDTSAKGALRVVESIWGDPAYNRLLIAEEDESYASEFKVYTLAGDFTGETFGRGLFKAQAEGVMLRTCGDAGWWITTEQGKDRSVFHLFDRHTLAPVGSFHGDTVANTDGIWNSQQASARFPQGALYAVHDDQGVVAFDWRDIAKALSLRQDCAL